MVFSDYFVGVGFESTDLDLPDNKVIEGTIDGIVKCNEYGGQEIGPVDVDRDSENAPEYLKFKISPRPGYAGNHFAVIPWEVWNRMKVGYSGKQTTDFEKAKVSVVANDRFGCKYVGMGLPYDLKEKQ